MCYIFSGQAPSSYRFVSRSVRLAGHSTSVRLEHKFWNVIDDIAEKQDMTTSRFLTTLYYEALETHGDVSNFASLLRCCCLLYLSEPEITLAVNEKHNNLSAHRHTRPLTV